MKQNKATKEQYTLFLNEKESVFVSSASKKGKFRKRSDSWFYLGYVGEIGFTIAAPIVGGVIIGSFIDYRWSSHPQATLWGIGIGGFVSFFGFIKIVQEIIKRK